jgi:hypothetical protein
MILRFRPLLSKFHAHFVVAFSLISRTAKQKADLFRAYRKQVVSRIMI